MSEVGNKAYSQGGFAETAEGNGRPFLDTPADDFRWTITGHTAWSRTYEGKRAVLDELLRPLAEQPGGRNVVSTERFVVDDDVVVIEGRNHSVTRSGRGPSEPLLLGLRDARRQGRRNHRVHRHPIDR